ncbi:jg13560, partial [Pararge aegeria aegeria]
TREVFIRWGRPEIDLFATKQTAVVKNYVSIDCKDRSANYIDAFSRPWRHQLAWVFPPPNLLPKVLTHLNSATGVYLIVAPEWPRAFWLQDLEIQGIRSPTRITEPERDPDRCHDVTGSASSADIDPESLENWGWGSQIKDWSTREKDLLKNSWRQSTLCTYLPAIKRWLSWCKSVQINPKFPQPAEVAKFLINLFLHENLSYSTILVHKSAVLTFCGPHAEQQSFSNFIVKHALKAISVAKPKAPRLTLIWDPNVVLEWLSSNPPKDTLFEISRRTATILLLASGRRVHDLTLLKISSDFFCDSGDNIYLIPAFGSKTDTHSYRQSAWKLSKHNDKNLCPVTLVRFLIEKNRSRRLEVEGLDNLFITVCNKTKAASRTVIGNWVRTVLKQSGINAPPGSCRSAVASLGWSDNQPIDDILSRADNKHVFTSMLYVFRRHINMTVLQNNKTDIMCREGKHTALQEVLPGGNYDVQSDSGYPLPCWVRH